MTYRWIAAFLIGIVGSTVWAADSPTAEALIQQLAAKDYRTRETAARALDERGAAVLSALRLAQNHDDPEVRQRITQMIARIERNTLLAPKLVTLHVEQKPLNDVLSELTEQTGYAVKCQNGNQHLVTLHADAMPFWQAIDQLCRQSGCSMQNYHDNSGALQLFRNNQFSPFVDYAGPFRIHAGSFYLSKTLDLNQNLQINAGTRRRTETLTLTLHVIGEPKAPLMSLGQVKVTTAVDDLGNSLAPPPTRAYESNYHNYYYGGRNPMMQTQVQLLGHGAATSLKHLKGSMPLTFLAEQRPEITIENILEVKNKKFDGKQVSLEIDYVKEQNGQTVIRATARRNAQENQHDYAWTNSLGQRVELHDAQGNKYNSEGFNWDSGSPTSVTGTFQFGKGSNKNLGKPAKLIYYDWVTTQHQVEFEFHDLPLP